MDTGENTEGFRKITDLTRKCSILLLAVHFYVYCYTAFKHWHLTHAVVRKILEVLHRTGLFDHFYVSKLAALICLVISLIGTRGRKDEMLSGRTITGFLITGFVFFWGSRWVLYVTAPVPLLAVLYMTTTSLGFLLILHGGALLSRLLKDKLAKDVFNRLQETFPQEEKLLDNEYSINLPAIYTLMATARSNQVATSICVQDFSQLHRDYGREQADVISSVAGNIISGQVTGDTARQLSERFGSIMQDRESISIHAMDTSISRSTQLEAAIPASRISSLSSGEMVGIVADNPDQKIKLKMFHSEIQNDHRAIKDQQDHYKPIPIVRSITVSDIELNYQRIKKEVSAIINAEMDRIYNTPELAGLLVAKGS